MCIRDSPSQLRPLLLHLSLQVTGTAYLHIDRGRGVTADLTLIKLRAAFLVSDVLSVAAKESKHGEKGAVGPTVEAAPFQKVRVGWKQEVFYPGRHI